MATWPVIIDDDGTGTSGTPTDYALFQLVKTYIDAGVTTTTPVYGSFTPIDLSGAGLAFSFKTGNYAKIGRVLVIFVHVVYPATALTQPAVIGGLPFVNNSVDMCGCFTVYGLPNIVWQINPNANTISIASATDMSAKTNAQMSGTNSIIVGVYYTS